MMNNNRNALMRRWQMGPALALGMSCFFGAAFAAGTDSSPSLDQLSARMDMADAQARRLEVRIAQDQSRVAPVQLADLFGESDEEKAARLQHEQNQDSGIATLNQRMGDLETTLRQLTGQLEQLDHRVNEQNDRMARMQKDFDYKLCSLAAQQLGAAAQPGDQSALPCNPGGQASVSTTLPPASDSGGPAANGPIHLSPPPGVLGTLPQSALGNLPQPQGGASPNQVASIATRPQFDAAMNLLAKAQYDEARAAFRNFADTYPRDELTPQAVYWVGDIAYVQKDYANAARAFAEELKKFPASPRAPESMLKLGQSLIAMNQKKEGCTALGAIESKYPTASKTVSEQALAIRKTVCR
jgi:tol-pal system protein YbgF